MTSQEFVNQLKKDIQAFPKIRIKHPFLKAVCATARRPWIRSAPGRSRTISFAPPCRALR